MPENPAPQATDLIEHTRINDWAIGRKRIVIVRGDHNSHVIGAVRAQL